jgi:hypothetical protein
VNSAEEMNLAIREIFALDSIGRGDEICGVLYVDYADESAKAASLIPVLEGRGVKIVWRK